MRPATWTTEGKMKLHTDTKIDQDKTPQAFQGFHIIFKYQKLKNPEAQSEYTVLGKYVPVPRGFGISSIPNTTPPGNIGELKG